MKERKINLGKDNVVKIFFYYAIPAILGMLAMTSAGIIDGIFVGQFVGSDALAAINLSLPILNILYGVGVMVAMGGATLANIKRGEKNIKESNNYYTVTISLIFAIAFIATIICFTFSSDFAYLMGSKEDTHELVNIYIKIISLFFIPYIANFALDLFIRNDGHPVFPIICTVSGAIINIILDYILIAELEMGIRGAAIATGIAQVIPMVAMIIFILLKSTWKLVRPNFRFKDIRDMMFNGSSELLSNISVGVSGLIFNVIIMKRIGTMGVAAYSVANYAAWVAIAIFFGIASAINPGVSFNKGSGDVKRIKQFKKIGLSASIVAGIILTVALLSFGDKVVYMFVGNNKGVHDLAIHIIRFYSISMIITGFNVVASMYYTAINQPLMSASISASRSLVSLIIGVLVLPIFFNENGIWSSVVFAEVVTLGIVLFCFKKKPY